MADCSRIPSFWLNMPVRALNLVKQFTRRIVVCTHRTHEILIIDLYDASRSVTIPAWTLPVILSPRGAFHLRDDIYVIECLGSERVPENWLLLYRLGDGYILRTIRLPSGSARLISKLDEETIIAVSNQGIHFHLCPPSLPVTAQTLVKTVRLEGIRQLWIVSRNTALVVCRKDRFRDKVGLVNFDTDAVQFFAEGDAVYHRYCRIGKNMILVGRDFRTFDVYDFNRTPPVRVHTESHNSSQTDTLHPVYGDRTGRDCFSESARFAKLRLPSIQGCFEVTTQSSGVSGESAGDDQLSIEFMNDLPDLHPLQDMIFLGPKVLVVGGRGANYTSDRHDGLYRHDKRADGTWSGPVEIATGVPLEHYHFYKCRVENVPDVAVDAFVAEVHAAKERRFGRPRYSCQRRGAQGPRA